MTEEITIDEEQKSQTIVDTRGIGAKFYLNGFPKSGLHLLDMLMRPLALPMPKDHRWLTPWAGLYAGNSWTMDMKPLEMTCYKMGRCQPGYFVKGHCGYVRELDRFMYYLGLIHIFIYRDLRDVAVSQAFHYINKDSAVFSHPEKELFDDMSFDEVLMTVITGIQGEKAWYAPLVPRWLEYEPWLKQSWVLSVRYEDLLLRPEESAKKIITHTVKRIGYVLGLPETEVHPGALEGISKIMAEYSRRTDISPTFREGKTGGWKEHFTREHMSAFIEYGGTSALIRAGYEVDW